MTFSDNFSSIGSDDDEDGRRSRFFGGPNVIRKTVWFLLELLLLLELFLEVEERGRLLPGVLKPPLLEGLLLLLDLPPRPNSEARVSKIPRKKS